MTRSLISRLRRFSRRQTGTATVEFVILFPIFISLAVSAVEMGILTLRQVMLERGIDLTVRSLRIGTMVNPTFGEVKTAICDNAMIIPNCIDVLHLELTPISTDSWTVPTVGVTCVNRTEDIDPLINANQINSGARNEFMLMRACSVFDPMFPNYGLGPKLPTDESGGYRLIASTSFVNEP
jgi:hypothetical protein